MAKKPKKAAAPASSIEIPATPYPPQRPRAARLDGESAMMADGQRWVLFPGYFLTSLDPIRDRLFDLWAAGRPFAVDDVATAAAALLSLNYELTLDEARLLVYGTIGRSETGSGFATAVLHSLVINFTQRWTYSEWQQTAFILAGVDASSVPVDKMPAMLAHLIAAGRVAPPEKYVGSLVHLDYRKQLLKATTSPTVIPPGMPA